MMMMVAAGNLFLLCLSASSYHCRHGQTTTTDGVTRRHLMTTTPLFGVKSSLSAGMVEGQGQIIDDDDNEDDDLLHILTLKVRQLQWEEKYLLLKQFKKREGHCNVPALFHTEDGIKLGLWVAHQRRVKKKEKLDPDRQHHLEEIGIEWTCRKPAQRAWDEWFALLQQFQKREGHCKVHAQHTEDGTNLGQWVANQRQLKTKEKLDPDRQKILEEIGIHWELRTATWENMYVLLKQFKKRKGHCNVSQSHTEDGIKLGLWVARQRHLKKVGKLDPDRQTLLHKIGFEWMWTSESWEEWFVLLKEFKKREGHCNVHVHDTEDGEHLGTWVSAQRQLKKKGKLDPDREKRLDEIGFEWARYTRMGKHSSWRKLAGFEWETKKIQLS
jgi:hypothetical protein